MTSTVSNTASGGGGGSRGSGGSSRGGGSTNELEEGELEQGEGDVSRARAKMVDERSALYSEATNSVYQTFKAGGCASCEFS
jgi:hypothetical protein